jgi:hypothetical protein
VSEGHRYPVVRKKGKSWFLKNLRGEKKTKPKKLYTQSSPLSLSL